MGFPGYNGAGSSTLVCGLSSSDKDIAYLLKSAGSSLVVGVNRPPGCLPRMLMASALMELSFRLIPFVPRVATQLLSKSEVESLNGTVVGPIRER